MTTGPAVMQAMRVPEKTGLMVLLVARPGEDVLDVENRRLLYLAATRVPGLSIAGLAHAAHLDENLVRYHVRVLERAGLVRTERLDGYRAVHPMTRDAFGQRGLAGPDDRALVALMRRPTILRIVLLLLESEPRTAGELSAACGVAASTMSHHLKRMERQTLVVVASRGREKHVTISDSPKVRRLLVSHPPPRDLVQGFVEAWDVLGL